MNINQIISQVIVQAPPFFLALTFHELAHGYIAWRLGDPTAKNAGRLTINPLKHLDPVGTIALFIIHFGWAKPVPVNPNYFKNPKQDMLLVALGGPTANLILAIISAILLKATAFFLINFSVKSSMITTILDPFLLMLTYSLIINIVLGCFNLLPIPPLDGSKILAGLLPEKLAHTYKSLERYGFIILLLLVFTNLLSRLIDPIFQFSYKLAMLLTQ